MLEEGYVECRIIGALLRVDDDLRLWAGVTAYTRDGLEILGKIIPMLVCIVSPISIGFEVRALFLPIFVWSPEHTEADFVANLDKIWRCSSLFKGFKCYLRITIQHHADLCIVLSYSIRCFNIRPFRPFLGDELLFRVCPRVRIMEIEQEVEACFLNPLAEFDDVSLVLNDIFAGLMGIAEDSYAYRIPSLFLHEGEHIGDFLAVLIKIGGMLLFVF